MRNSEETIFEAHIRDLVMIAEKTGKISFSGFLNECEASSAQRIVRDYKCDYIFFGGYESAERSMLAISYDNTPDRDDFPIKCLKITSTNKNSTLSHRDYMGALMSEGIKRDSFGDIIVFSDYAYVFVNSIISDFLMNSITSVGKERCNVSQFDFSALQFDCNRFVEKSIIISSNRIDCFVAVICSISREKSSEIIKDRLVFINGIEVKNPSQKINTNDKIVIRRSGKYIVGPVEGKTHKNRLKLTVKKYN